MNLLSYFAAHQPQLYVNRYDNLQLHLNSQFHSMHAARIPKGQVPTGTAPAPALNTYKSDVDKQPMQERAACVSCVWNEANAVRVQHLLPLKDLHISLGCRGTELGLHSLTMLLPASPFELGERKLIQVGPSVLQCCLTSALCGTAVLALHFFIKVAPSLAQSAQQLMHSIAGL